MIRRLGASLAACSLFFAGPAAATPVADLAWLEGSWEGAGVAGAPALEVYSKAADGQMVGHFRQLNADGTVMFYELITIGSRDGVLTYSLKHFNADLTGWEEQNTVRRFPLSTTKPERWEFSGIVYERTGTDSMTVTVATKSGGADETLVFHFKRDKK
jgi:hypothetical protein